MPRSFRVLMVNDLPPGEGSGAEVALSRLVEGLRRRGDEVHVFAGEVRHRGAGRVLDLWDPWARRALARRADAVGADVIHHHNVLRELSVSVLGVPRGVPCVLTVHDHRLLGVADGSLRGVRGQVDRLVKRPGDAWAARRAVDATLAVSAELGEGLGSAGFRGVRVVDNPGGDPGPEPPPPSASQTVLCAGRLSPDKGIHVLLRAWEQVAAQHAAADLVVVGDGPSAGPLREVAAGLPRVRMTGRLRADAVRDLLRSARVVVVPSLPAQRLEGTPLVAVEAALHGRSLVVSDDPGLASLVGALGAGAVVPAGDVGALADAVSARLADPAAADAEGAALRAAAVPRFSTDASAAQVHAVYESLVHG